MTEAGALVVLHRTMAGTLFAEAPLFSKHYHCDAIGAQSGERQRFDKSVMVNALKIEPEFAVSFSQLLALQVQRYRQIIELVSIKSAKERVFVAVQIGMLNGAVTELASHIGLTHKACYRALRSLVDKGRANKRGRGHYGLKGTPDI